MSNTWFESLQGQLEDPIETAESPTGVWKAIKASLNPVEQKPKANANVVSQELKDRNGPYFIVKNQEKKTYLRLSPAQFRLFNEMNGENTVQDLIVEHFMATGNFAHNLVTRLVEELAASHMLAETPVFAWRSVNEKIEKRSLFYKISAPARFVLTQKMAVNNIDRFMTALYRTVGWLFFTRLMQPIYIGVSVIGLFAFSAIVSDPVTYQFFGEKFFTGVALIWVAMILPVVIHELGHALTVKHYGREVPQGGLMIYFGMPAAFVETTDIWMEPRKARLAVTWNGPYTGLILSGALSIFMYLNPQSAWNSFFFKMVGYTLITFLFNVNPLLKYDGYYILSDALDISSLRERSLVFIRKHLISHIVERKRLTRDEWIFSVYGILSMLWTAYALVLISNLWKTRVAGSVQIIFGAGISTAERVFSIVMAAGMVSLVVLMSIALARLFGQVLERHNQAGGLTQHVRLAVILGILAAAIGIWAPRLLNQWTTLLGLVLTGWAAYRLWAFSRPYQGSHRGTALRLISAGVAAAGVAETGMLFRLTVPIVVPLAWAAIALILVAGLVLTFQQAASLKIGPLVLGFGLGIAAFFLLGLTRVSLGVQIASGALAMLTVWNFFGLRGSARSPAVALLGLGGLVYLASWELGLPWSFFSPGTLVITGLSLLAAAALHWVYAQLPPLSTDESNIDSLRTKEAVGLSVSTIVRRVIAQVFFETGLQGVHRFGEAFSATMKENGLKLRIEGNRFFDDEFERRTVIELTQLYQLAFDTLHGQLCRDLGSSVGSLVFNYGVDRLPWQNREVIFELILSRCEWSSGITEQHEDGKKRLIGFLKRVPLFVTMDDDGLARISQALETEQYAAGETLMQEGDAGDKFYIIEHGQATFWQKDQFNEDVRVAEKGPGQFFGEVALVSNAPRNATVRADTPLTVLTLTKAKFDDLVRSLVPLSDRDTNIVRRSWLLRSMPIFDELESHELDWLAVNMERETIAKGTVLFNEGDPGDRFYIVESGELMITTKQNENTREISRVKSGEYVGEIALLQNKPRTASITAAEDSTLLSLAGEDFLDLVSGYSSLGKSVTHTSSRRLSYLEKS